MEWELYKGNCFDYLPEIEDKSIDMILCDLPYGTTACKWDTPLDLNKLWEEYKRIIKDNGAICLTSSQPFTTKLINSRIDLFKYNWVWNKKKPGGIGFAKYQPMRVVEDICIFSKKRTNYYPQMVKRDKIKISKNYKHSKMNHESLAAMEKNKEYTHKYPKNLITFSNANQRGKVHPTQKPIELFEYLIKTYTKEGDLVLDNCAGSGTTGVACMNLNRDCIMMELEDEYCDIILKRMAENDQQKLI